MCDPIAHPGWDGWYFEDGYLCTPQGDRFTALAVHACFFYRQLSQVHSLMRCEVDREDSPLFLGDQSPLMDGRWLRVRSPLDEEGKGVPGQLDLQAFPNLSPAEV